jgi:hypothetical protein
MRYVDTWPAEVVTQRFLKDVHQEFLRAMQKHPMFHSLHEGYGVIAEELAEFFEHVRKKEKEHKSDLCYKELVQIAAMALKCAIFVRS